MRHTQRFETVDFEDGIVVSKRNLTGVFTLNEDSKNLTFGNRDGIGPRYGTAPLPYHTHTQTVAASGDMRNIRTSEDASAALTSRTVHLWILSFNSRINESTSQSVYLMLSQRQVGGYYGVSASVIGNQTSTAKTANDTYGGYGSFSGGFPAALSNTYFNNTFASSLSAGLDGYSDSVTFSATNSLAWPSAAWRLRSTNQVTDIEKAITFARVSFLTVTGAERPLQFLLAFISPSKAPVALGAGNDTPGDLCFSLTGNPNDYFYGVAPDNNNPRTFFLLQDAFPAWYSKYSLSFTSIAGLTRKISNDLLNKNASYSFTSTGTVTLLDGLATTDIDAVYVYDKTMKHRSNYKLIAVASGGKPLFYIWRDDFNSYSKKAILGGASTYNDNKVELFDASNIHYFVPSQYTINAATGSGGYQEDDAVVPTVWYRWPNYVNGSATTMPAALMTLGAANTGLLRANTTYEFTYSVYDATINYETNVGVAAKLRTGATDFVGLYLLKTSLVSSRLRTPSWQNVFENPNSAFYDHFLANINFREYRIYYRELGTFEWLPAATIPCVEALFTPEEGNWALCVNPIASLPGGQPGGFIDYSALPQADYIDTVTFSNRTFWLSKSQLHFSLRNNPLAYPVRNAVACPNGEFLGMIPHAYPGQAEQGARLVIFGSRETYTARFIVGAEQQARVRIGPDDAATFPVDGTNFIVDVWTSITAFSGRSAVVGDGILYYWGPQGVYRDDGVALPAKISEVLEPWIDGIYDANNTQAIHGVFNSNTDEAIWFYQPNTQGGAEQASRAIVYHAKMGSWSRWEFNDLVIDNAQVVESTKWDTANDELAGTRIVVAVRDPSGIVSRPMFLDEVIFAGDMQADSQYMVKSVTHTDATTRRLTFATGPASIANKTGTAAIVGFQKYTGNTSTDPDGIYTITAAGADYIEVTRQSASADIPAGALNENEYFPVWLGTSQSIACVLKSQYWVPAGMDFWGRWLYCHTSYQVSLVYDQVGTSYDLPVRYYSLPGTDYSTQTITLTDNSRGNCQILNSIPFTKDNASGQGVAYECVFSHLAGEFKLQYIAFDVAPEDKANIRFWEG